jgi:hypothetical protein
MRTIRVLVLICAVCSMLAMPIAAQGNRGGGPGGNGGGDYGQAPGPAGAVGADGTLYVLVPNATTTSSSGTTVTDLAAIGVAASPSTAWRVSLSGDIGPVMPGASFVYVMQTLTSGAGTSATRTTAVLWLAAATGSQTRSTALSGNVDHIEVKTVGTKDYLYVYATTTTSSTSGSTTTTTATRTVTIYAPDGTIVKTVTL